LWKRWRKVVRDFDPDIGATAVVLIGFFRHVVQVRFQGWRGDP
jgi:hypothetical protein